MAAAEMASCEDAQHRKPRLNRKTLFVLGAMNLIDCINVNLLTPYVDKMVSTYLNQSPQSPAVAHTVGMLIGLYSLCEVIFSPLWGTFADKVGRKPALLIGLGGSCIAPVMFGLGTSLPTIFAARALDGFFCGNMGVTRTYLGEIVDESNEAKGFSFLALCFSVGLFVGPILGGELVFPAERAPHIFGGTIFETYPFLLPNLTYAIFAAIAWVIGCIFLEETLPASQRCSCLRRRAPSAETVELPPAVGLVRSTSGTDPSGAPTRFVPDEGESSVTAPKGKRYPMELIQTIVSYCGLSGTTAAQNQLLILLVSYEKSAGGFEFGPRDIGFLQNIGAVGLLSSQLFLYPKLTKKFGFLNVFLLGFCMAHLSYGFFPVYGLFYDKDKYGMWRFVPLGCMQFMYTASTGMMFPTAFAFINRAAEGLNRGAVNGWANSSGALCRAAFPPASAVLLSISTSWGPLGRYLPLYIVTVIAAICLERLGLFFGCLVPRHLSAGVSCAIEHQYPLGTSGSIPSPVHRDDACSHLPGLHPPRAARDQCTQRDQCTRAQPGGRGADAAGGAGANVIGRGQSEREERTPHGSMRQFFRAQCGLAEGMVRVKNKGRNEFSMFFHPSVEAPQFQAAKGLQLTKSMGTLSDVACHTVRGTQLELMTFPSLTNWEISQV